MSSIGPSPVSVVVKAYNVLRSGITGLLSSNATRYSLSEAADNRAFALFRTAISGVFGVFNSLSGSSSASAISSQIYFHQAQDDTPAIQAGHPPPAVATVIEAAVQNPDMTMQGANLQVSPLQSLIHALHLLDPNELAAALQFFPGSLDMDQPDVGQSVPTCPEPLRSKLPEGHSGVKLEQTNEEATFRPAD